MSPVSLLLCCFGFCFTGSASATLPFSGLGEVSVAIQSGGSFSRAKRLRSYTTNLRNFPPLPDRNSPMQSIEDIIGWNKNRLSPGKRFLFKKQRQAQVLLPCSVSLNFDFNFDSFL
jgi:hypothetical protein